jgi:hypothetical protein
MSFSGNWKFAPPRVVYAQGDCRQMNKGAGRIIENDGKAVALGNL